MPKQPNNNTDKEPAEGSRETIDYELNRTERGEDKRSSAQKHRGKKTSG